MIISAGKFKFNQQEKSIICFCLFSCWLLSVPFEGQVLYKLMENYEVDGITLIIVAIFANFIGLFSGGFFIKKQNAAKMTMITSIVVCISGSFIFFLPFSKAWHLTIFFVALFSAFFIASWGFYLKTYFSGEKRLKTMASCLIYSNILMIFINVIAVNVSAYIALSISIVALLCALFITLRLEGNTECKLPKTKMSTLTIGIPSIRKPMLFLCLFILIFTINSGIMYQVVNPAFSHLTLLASYYWAIPYIMALLILRNFSDKINQAYILNTAMAMLGLSFILFNMLDRSVFSYLVIDTLMMGAFGVCDLFWWSMLGSFFDYSKNPAKILGVGLSINVLGILIGRFVGSIVAPAEGGYGQTSIIALVIVFIIIIFLPMLNNHLSRVFKNHIFLFKLTSMDESKRDSAITDFQENNQLTDREIEVVELLLQGYTYKAIAERLFISENTMKYHVKNIYQKLNINSKMELIKIFVEN